MESEKCTVLCSDYTCRFCRGGGYYGICKHPDNVGRFAYAGIDRYYMSSCKLKVVENEYKKQQDSGQ